MGGYSKLRSTRRLEWRKAAGLIKIKIEIGEEEHSLQVTPAQATVLYAFQEKEMSLKDLSEKVNLPEDVAMRNVQFWLGKGIVRQSHLNGETVFELNDAESGNVFELNDDCGNEGANDDAKAGKSEAETSMMKNFVTVM